MTDSEKVPWGTGWKSIYKYVWNRSKLFIIEQLF